MMELCIYNISGIPVVSFFGGEYSFRGGFVTLTILIIME
jgi:hypothetical protein